MNENATTPTERITQVSVPLSGLAFVNNLPSYEIIFITTVSVPLSGLAFVNISNPVKKEKVQSSFPSPYRG